MSLIQPASPLREAFVSCHSEGHQWRHEGKVGGSEPGMRPPFGWSDSVATHSVCTSCTSERFRWYTRSGEVIPRYHYADGYLHKKRSVEDEAAPTKQWWRQQLVVSLFEDMVPIDVVPKAAPRRRRAS